MSYILNNLKSLGDKSLGDKSHIEIIKPPNRYEIHMSNNRIHGFLFVITGILDTNIIKICEKQDKQDYAITYFMSFTKET